MKTEQYIEQAIVQLLSLHIKAGHSIAEVDALVRKCVREAKITAKSGPRHRGLDIHRLGSVLRTWHKEAQYLTFDGTPRPLKGDGRYSLKTLVRKFYPSETFEAVFERLLEAKLIQRYGSDQWVPSEQTARISQLSLETLEHLSEGIARYTETVTRNVTAKSDQDVLFERSAKVTGLPVSEINAFRQYVGQQALAFIIAIDDWLESRSVTTLKSKARRCTAGVYTFAYIAAEGEKRPTPAKARVSN